METWGDVLIQVLWYLQYNSTINVKIGDTDTYSYRFDPMSVLLAWWDKIKRDKNGNHRNDQRKQFFSVCSFCRWHTREVSPGRNCEFESTHGSENGRTHFSHVGLDKQSDCNCVCKILLTNDPQRSTP